MLTNIRSYEENLHIVRSTMAKMTQTEEGIKEILDILAASDWEPLFEDQRRLQRYCVLCGTCYRVHTPDEQASFCSECHTETRAREAFRVYQQNRRTKLRGLASTLTVIEWLATLDYFKWKCAYCQKSKSVALDHFIPIDLGGGSTFNNCLPACKRCNQLKANKHPNDVIAIPLEDIKRVQTYLEQFST